MPNIIFLETVSSHEWKVCEKRWIARFRELEPELVNVKPGGSGLNFVSEETRQKMREAKQHGFIPWNKGKRGVQVAWNKGQHGLVKASEETKRKMSLIHAGQEGFWKGKKMSAVTRAKMRRIGSENHFFGKKHTKETKAKISESQRKRLTGSQSSLE